MKLYRYCLLWCFLFVATCASAQRSNKPYKEVPDSVYNKLVEYEQTRDSLQAVLERLDKLNDFVERSKDQKASLTAEIDSLEKSAADDSCYIEALKIAASKGGLSNFGRRFAFVLARMSYAPREIEYASGKGYFVEAEKKSEGYTSLMNNYQNCCVNLVGEDDPIGLSQIRVFNTTELDVRAQAIAKANNAIKKTEYYRNYYPLGDYLKDKVNGMNALLSKAANYCDYYLALAQSITKVYKNATWTAVKKREELMKMRASYCDKVFNHPYYKGYYGRYPSLCKLDSFINKNILARLGIRENDNPKDSALVADFMAIDDGNYDVKGKAGNAKVGDNSKASGVKVDSTAQAPADSIAAKGAEETNPKNTTDSKDTEKQGNDNGSKASANEVFTLKKEGIRP